MNWGKRGKLYIKFAAATALLFTLAFAFYAFAANPSASPAIVTDRNFSNSNVSSAVAISQKGTREGGRL